MFSARWPLTSTVSNLSSEPLASEHHGSERARVVTKPSANNLHALHISLVQEIFVRGFADGPDEMLTEAAGDAAAHHHTFRVEQVHHVGRQNPKVVLSALHHFLHQGVLLVKGILNDATGHPALVSLLHYFEHHALASSLDGRAYITLHGGAAGESRGAASMAAAAQGSIHQDHGV